ncbi:PilC/PilY family type IV pilus protein [Dyella silvae]|uniref:PilC/PilY family type IV pilus protein n=1 Tax=Dyella silvae TaxID=2994424 RepID=UPI0022653C71|nr:PilC/PilY family type IV pilus protein [Dyella silvae]
MSTKHTKLMCFLAGLLVSGTTVATSYVDNFSSTKASLDWKALNDACLTAGVSTVTSTIPACATQLAMGSTTKYVIAAADADKSGALRLTPGMNNQTGAILSNFTFNPSQGLQVTFTTYTYGGDSGGTAKNGADGISFLLTDGTFAVPSVAGGLGGSMGYSCSNGNSTYEGLANAYLGLGVDEFGNFLNKGDNTNTGIYNTNNTNGVTTNGSNSFANNVSGSVSAGSGPYYQPERIGLRGAGNTTWAWLQSQNPSYYSDSTVNQSKVQAACKSGQYVASVDSSGNKTMATIPYNYAVVPGGYAVLPGGFKSGSTSTYVAGTQLIADNAVTTRLKSDGSQNAWPITYKLTISSKGLLNFSYSYNNGAYTPVLTNADITQSSGPLPSLFRFGFSAGTGGSNNVHEITCFQATPLQSNSSAAANTVQSGQVRTNTQVYLASYSTDGWWGSLVSDQVTTTGGVVGVSSTANWDANCVLTGGGCPNMGTDTSGNPTNTITVQAPTARTLLTSDDSTGAGLALQWSSLNANEKSVLNSTDSAGQSRLTWLRGDRTNEQLQSSTGTLRARSGVLGDIINSSPTWVGQPTSGNFPDAFNDFLYGNPSTAPENASGAQAYSAFVSAYATRQNVVYVGGNDGFMHGFRTGAFKSDGTYDSSTNDGHEVIGFMPSGQLDLYAADLANPKYVHDFVVDATPAVGDLFYGSKWHTWLVSGVGSGGAEIFALDITDPTTFKETNAGATVKGDWISSSSVLPNLGQTVGTPIIVRLHNGQWAIIFGNGINPTGGTQTAGIYIGLVDSTSGAVTFQFVNTGAGSGSSPNGIAYVSSADLDGDHITDYVYGGDVLGNVWRFDLTSSDSTKWAASKLGNTTATPLYIAQDASSNRQPITTAPVIASVQTGSVSRVMVLFGTGQKTPFTSSSSDVYASGTQTFYGIWDWDMSGWNTSSSASSSPVTYASLSGTQSFTRTSLLQEKVVSQSSTGNGAQVLGYRTLSTGNQVCWQGSTTCTPSTTNTQYGWYFDFPDSQEQVIYNPALIGGAVVVSSAEPPVVSALKCNPGLQTGWTMAFDPASGGGLKTSFFPDANGSFGSGSDPSSVSGIRLDAVGTPTVVTYGGQSFIVTQTIKGVPSLNQVNPSNGNSPSRVSWREIKQ